VTATFDPPSTRNVSIATFSASSSAGLGDTTPSIIATSGSISRSSWFHLLVKPQGTPSFSLSATPASLALSRGASATSTLAVKPSDGFGGTVALTASGLPSGVTATFNPTSTTGTSIATFTASSSAAEGSTAVTVVGTSIDPSGNLVRSTVVELTISVPATPDFSLSATPGSATVDLGATATSAVAIAPTGGFSGSVALTASGLPNGVTATFSPNPTTGSSTATFTASSTASTGTTSATITGTSGSLVRTTTLSLAVKAPIPPSFSLSASPVSVTVNRGASATTTVTVIPDGGFSGSVALTATGLPAGIKVAFSPDSATRASTATFTADADAGTGTTQATITGTSGSLVRTASVSLTVSAYPYSLALQRGESATSVLAVARSGGFAGSVALMAFGLPSGVTATFDPESTAGMSTATFTASSTAINGRASVTITAASGTLVRTAAIEVIVSAPETPSFEIWTIPGDLVIRRGTSAACTVAIIASGGFTGAVSLSVAGLPDGVVATFIPAETPGAHTVTFAASASTAAGTYDATVTGASGDVTASENIVVTVVDAPGEVTGGDQASTATGSCSAAGASDVALAAAGLLLAFGVRHRRRTEEPRSSRTAG
jgi:uncharacterized membrane protein